MAASVLLPPLPRELPRESTAEAVLLRICRSAYATSEPAFRAARIYRFDCPDASFGTCYAARDFKTCFFETVVRSGRLQIPRSEYESRSVAVLLLDAARLHLVPVHGDAAKRLRLDLADVAGHGYAYPQALAQAIHNHASQPHGIVYRSRYDDGALATVLFERAQPHVRLFPPRSIAELSQVSELGDALRNVVPFELV